MTHSWYLTVWYNSTAFVWRFKLGIEFVVHHMLDQKEKQIMTTMSMSSDRLLSYCGVLLMCLWVVAAQSDEATNADVGESSWWVGSGLGFGTLLSSMGGLLLGSLTVALMHITPPDPNRRRVKRVTGHRQGGGSDCSCCQ